MRRALLFAALVLAAHGCSRCGRASTGPSPELARVLPRDADLVMLVPDLGALGEALVRLQQLKLANFAAQLQGAGSAPELVGGAMFQLGADLRSRESMELVGLDPARGAAAVWMRGGAVYAVAAVKDQKSFQALVKRLARDRLGANVSSEANGVLSFSRAQGGPPALSVLFRDGWAFVAQGELGARLPELAAVGESAALSTDAEYQQGLQRAGKGWQALFRIPGTSSRMPRAGLHGGVASLTVGAGTVTVKTVLPWPNTSASAQLLVKEAGGVPDLFGMAAPDAFLLARSAGNPAGLAPVWPALAGRWVENAVRESGFDLEGALFGNLKPGSVLSLSLAPTVNLATGVPELDVRRTNPFGYVQLVVAGQVKDAAKAASTLEAIPKVAQRFGATLTPATREGQRVYLTRYARGEGAHLALVGDTVLMAAPVSRLDESLSRAREHQAAEGLAADPRFKAPFEQPFGVVVDLRRLAASVRALPSSAWGVGGFAMKATALRWLDATDDLLAISWWAGLSNGAVESQLQLHLEPPAQAPK